MALVAGKTIVASGSGIWTIGLPADGTIAIDDPGVEGQVPTVDLMLDLKSTQPSMITFTGPPAPNPADSIGYTAATQIEIKNDTGHAINGLLLTLANVDQKLPLSLVPGVIEFGHSVNANYAYWSQPQPVKGETTALFSPDNQPTTPTGAAASTLALNGTIPAGGSVTVASTIHNTELNSGNNNFVLNVTPV
jgi:hypothetical protein